MPNRHAPSDVGSLSPGGPRGTCEPRPANLPFSTNSSSFKNSKPLRFLPKAYVNLIYLYLGRLNMMSSANSHSASLRQQGRSAELLQFLCWRQSPAASKPVH